MINALAVVLLAGSLAIVVEGTRFGEPVIDAHTPVTQLSGDPAAPVPVRETEVETADAAEGEPSPTLPLPRSKPTDEKVVATMVEPQRRPHQTDIEAAPSVEEVPAVEQTPVVPQRRLRVVTEGEFPPFNYIDEKGDFAGFDIATVREVCRRIEAECTIAAKPWDDLQPALLSDEADVIAASLRIETVPGSGTMFSEPYYAVQGRFVGQRAATRGLLDLISSGRVAVQAGTIHAAYLAEVYPHLVPLQVNRLAEAFDALETQKADLVFADNATVLDWVKDRNCCVAVGARVEHPVLFGAGVGFALRTSDETLKQDIDHALASMRTDGTLEQLSVNYFGGRIF
ncbi:MAG: transporter substrate-binding domain-containing protein [Parvibaculum sp.]